MLSPDGRVIMISGAGRGIGLAISRLLAARGYSLSLGGRDVAAIEAASADLPAERVLRQRWQAEDRETATAWVEATLARFGRLDGIVANAGVSLPAPLEGEDERGFDGMWEVNFKGPLRLIRAGLPALRASGSGRLIMISSLAGKRLLHDNPGYPASKHAAMALTHAVRRAGWDDGVRATAICPGLVDTDMVAHRPTPQGQYKIEPETIAESVVYALALPNSAVVAEMLINSRFEPMF